MVESVMETFTGRELAAKMRDGDFDTVETLASLNTFDVGDEKQGTAVGVRIEISEDTLMSRFSNLKFSIENQYDSENKVVVELRV